MLKHVSTFYKSINTYYSFTFVNCSNKICGSDKSHMTNGINY